MNKSIWNSASVPGLVLGGVCIAYELINWLCSDIETPVLAGILATVLWALKFGGCIALMVFFMKRYAASDAEIDNSDTFRFGTVVALYSAIFYAAFYFAYTVYIVPDIYKQAFDAILSSSASMLDQNSLDQIMDLEPRMPAIGCAVKLIYSFLFGLVLSAILSRNIPSRNPFVNDTPDEQ